MSAIDVTAEQLRELTLNSGKRDEYISKLENAAARGYPTTAVEIPTSFIPEPTETRRDSPFTWDEEAGWRRLLEDRTRRP